MTEPGIGSDLAGMAHDAPSATATTTFSNGSKTFITNGINSDLVIAARPTRRAAPGHVACSIVERACAGFERGRNLEKLGQHSQDTAELFFNDVRGAGSEPAQQRGRRLQPGHRTTCPRSACRSRGGRGSGPRRAGLDARLRKERKAFGQPIGSFQNSKFRLAEMATEVEIGPHVHRSVRARASTPEGSPPRTPRWRSGGRTEMQKRCRRRLPAAVRRLRLHARVPHRPGLRRRPGRRRSTAAPPRS